MTQEVYSKLKDVEEEILKAKNEANDTEELRVSLLKMHQLFGDALHIIHELIEIIEEMNDGKR